MRANLIWPYLCYFEKWFQVHRGGSPSNIAHNDKCSAISFIYLTECDQKNKQLSSLVDLSRRV